MFPGLRKNEVLSFLRSNERKISQFQDQSHSLSGVEVPGDSGHVMYVWFDALANYITTIGYGYNADRLARWWPT